MTCPKCNNQTTITNVVHVPYNETYRSRKCRNCGHVFYTAEFEVEANKRFKKEWNQYVARDRLK